MPQTLEEELEELALREFENYLLCEKSLAHYIKCAWDILEPGRSYHHNWHIDCIADHLEAVNAGQIKRLLINMPPRQLKSIAVTVCYPTWVWGPKKKPEHRFFSASFSAELSTKHNVDKRELIRSSWYQAFWGNDFKLAEDQDAKKLFKNDKRGQMYSTSVGGGGTGEGGDTLSIDDPVNPKMAASEPLRTAANEWRDQTLSTRKNDKKESAEIIVMQRLAKNDMSGHVLEKDPEGWVHLCLEGQFQKRRVISFPFSKREKIVEEGEYLHPEREGEKEHAQSKLDLGSAGYQSQILQNPMPQKGGFFKRSWWKRHREAPKKRRFRAQFWDTASVPGSSNDYSVCATWDQHDEGYCIPDVWRERVAFPELEQAAIDLYNLHKPDAIVIEFKGSGISLYQSLKKKGLPVIKWDPGQRSKPVRAAAATPTVEAGNVSLPENAKWAEPFIVEHEFGPELGDFDDQVDTTGMAIDYFKNNNVGKFSKKKDEPASAPLAPSLGAKEQW